MKKILFLAAALLGLINHSFAQNNSNPWPTSGNVGIGTTSPTSLLSVGGNSSILNYQQVGFRYNPTITSGAGGLLSLQMIANPSANSSAGLYSLFIQMGSDVTSTSNIGTMFGLVTSAVQRGTGVINTVNNAYISSPILSSTGTITNSYGVNIRPQQITGVTKGYGLYQAGASDVNYFEGNVGIGTVTPGLKAHIAGAIGFPATTGNVQTGVLRLQGLTSNAVLDFGVSGASGASLQVTNQNDLTASYPLLLNPNGGNVGLGTKSPNAKLDIQLATSITPLATADEGLRLSTPTASTSNSTHVSSPIIKLFGGIWNGTVNSSRGFTQQVTGISGINYGYRLAIGSTDVPDALSITGLNGNVGIGTVDTKGYKFAVNGSVVANAITVKVYPWADYVFNKDYKLPTLTEVKHYIDNNHHLPDMPSAAQVEKNGLNLGEINTTLTKKVEELTLYLITKDEDLKKQQQEIASQKSDIEILKQQMKDLTTLMKNKRRAK